MKTGTKLSLTALGVTVAGCAVLLRLRAAAWQRETDALVEQLKQAAVTNNEPVSFQDFGDLPAPVAAYFRFALKEGQARVHTAKIRHEGTFKIGEKWIPFVSTQAVSTHPSGFVWDATMKMNPFLPIRVRDSYVAGRGAMSAKVMSLISVVNAHDDARLNAGALLRYLAELAWLPTGLLPSENLKWTAIDARKALATLHDGGTTVSLEFRFSQRGEISGVFAPARPYAIKGGYQSFPWVGRFWNYRQRNGMMIPLEGEVAWQMPQGNAPYWKARIVDVESGCKK